MSMLNRFHHSHDHPLIGNKELLTDARKLFRAHMMNQHHVITDEDLEKIRIGMVEEEKEKLAVGSSHRQS